MGRALTPSLGHPPFDNIEAGDTVLATHSIQVAIQDSHAHTGATSASWCHLTQPLVCLRIISAEIMASITEENTGTDPWKTQQEN